MAYYRQAVELEISFTTIQSPFSISTNIFVPAMNSGKVYQSPYLCSSLDS